jgi:anti-sigma factor RsiW
MRCHEAEALLAPQFSDSLDPATQRDLALHLDSCAACRARLQQEYELDRSITAAVNLATPAGDDLVARIEQKLEGKLARRFFPSPWRWPSLVGAAAVILFCAIVLTRFTATNSMHALCLDAVDDHRTEVVLREPRRWHSSNEINDLVRRTVPAAQIPQTIAGLPLQKGRICGLLQAQALHLVYGNGAQQVSVFVMLRRDLPSDSLPLPNSAQRLHQENDGGIGVASFAGDGLGVVVVGNPDLARNVADQLTLSL